MARPQAQARPPFAWLRFLTLIVALAPAPVSAGAWIDEEEGQEIWTYVAGENGVPGVAETSAYWEIPILDRSALVVAPWVESTAEVVEGWRAESTIALKHAVFERGRTAMALQAGALWISHPPAGCSQGGAELRWLGGRSFGDGDTFLNLEAAGRALDGGCLGGRAELTLGYRPSDAWLGLGQVFYDQRAGTQDTIKLQVTVVRYGMLGRGLQIGLRGRIDGGPPEPALVLGFWGRPGD